MTTTPITDKWIFEIADTSLIGERKMTVVAAHVARELERKLADEREQHRKIAKGLHECYASVDRELMAFKKISTETVESLEQKIDRLSQQNVNLTGDWTFERERAEKAEQELALATAWLVADKEPFTSRELALEMLAWFERDIPQTVVATLRIILKNYVNTGIYDDKINEMCGRVVDPPLLVQRVMRENAEFRRRLENYGDGECLSCVNDQCTAGPECVTMSNPVPKELE